MPPALPDVTRTRLRDTPPAAREALRTWVRPARRLIGLAVVAGATEGALLVVQASLVASIVHGAFLQGRGVADLAQEFWGLALVTLARAAAAFVREDAGFRGGAQVRTLLRRTLLDRLLRSERASRAERAPGELATATVEQVEALHDYVARYLPQRAIAALVPLLVLAAVAPLSWAGALLLLGTAPLIPLFAWLVGMGAARASQRQFEALARLGAHFVDRLHGLATLRLLHRVERETRAVGQAAEEVRRRTMGVLRIAFLTAAVLEFFSALGLGIMAVYLGLTLLGSFDFGLYGRPLTFEVALFLLILAAEFYLPLRTLGSLFHARAEAEGAAQALARVLRDSPALPPPPAAPEPAGAWSWSGPVRLEGVEVRLGPHERPVLQDLDLVLAPGERVAVVGPSGAGKTTLLGLLLGLHAPARGRVWLGDRERTVADLPRWRQHLAWVGQQPRLFHGSLADNIALGAPQASRRAIEAAADAAGVRELARELPQGLDTVVGELGVGLSGGQIQRVALARASLRAAPLVLLDEPTANLDADNERWVLAALERLAEGRTLVVVTHHLAACRAMDRILVLDQGRLVEQGPHASLATAGGLYQRLLEGRDA